MTVSHELFVFVKDNEVVLALLATAGISTMPKSDASLSWRTIYGWFYDWLHLFLNFKRPQQPATDLPPAKPLWQQNTTPGVQNQ